MSLGTKVAQRLANKIVLITGASSGIGEATAREFAAAANGDIRLILAARREERLKALKDLLTKEYPSIKIHSTALDVSAKLQVHDFVSSLPHDFADIDVLINNAGKALGRSDVGTLEDDDVSGMIDTNVTGLINLTNSIVKIFKKKNSGDIVNVGSIAGREAYPGGSVYCATKAAVRYFTTALRKELISTRIRVLEVDPGAVLTEFSLVRFHGDENQASEVYKDTDPLEPEDIADAIVYAVSRKLKVVIAEQLIFPTYQAGAAAVYKGSLDK